MSEFNHLNTVPAFVELLSPLLSAYDLLVGDQFCDLQIQEVKNLLEFSLDFADFLCCFKFQLGFALVPPG